MAQVMAVCPKTFDPASRTARRIPHGAVVLRRVFMGVAGLRVEVAVFMATGG